jgi:hypothetical protein
MADPEFEPPEHPDLLSLGLVVGGNTPSNELVREAFMALMRGIRERRGGYPNEGLRINIVFKVPGPFSSPDFEGVFPARYARKTSHLLVNAAVPASVTFDQVPGFFVQALLQTKAATLEYLRARKIGVDTTAVMALIDDLASERAAS